MSDGGSRETAPHRPPSRTKAAEARTPVETPLDEPSDIWPTSQTNVTGRARATYASVPTISPTPGLDDEPLRSDRDAHEAAARANKAAREATEANADYYEKVREAQEQAEKWQKQLTQVNSEKAKLEKTIHNLSNENKGFAQQVADLQKAQNESARKFSDSEKAREADKSLVKQLKDEVKSLVSELQDEQAERTKMRADLTELESTNKLLHEEIDRAEAINGEFTTNEKQGLEAMKALTQAQRDLENHLQLHGKELSFDEVIKHAIQRTDVQPLRRDSSHSSMVSLGETVMPGSRPGARKNNRQVSIKDELANIDDNVSDDGIKDDDPTITFAQDQGPATKSQNKCDSETQTDFQPIPDPSIAERLATAKSGMAQQGTFNEELKKRRAKITELEKKVFDLNNKKATTRMQQADDQKNAAKTNNTEMEAVQKRHKDLEAAYVLQMTASKTIAAETEALRKRNKALEAAYAAQIDASKTKATEIRTHATEMEALQKRIKQLEKESKSDNQTMEELAEQNAEYINENGDLQKQVDAMKSQLAAKDQELKDRPTEIAPPADMVLRSEMDEKDELIESLRESLRTGARGYSSLKISLDHATRENEKKTKALYDSKEAMRMKTGDLEARVAAATTEIETLKKQSASPIVRYENHVPGWWQVVFGLMMLLLAFWTYANIKERNMWLDANDLAFVHLRRTTGGVGQPHTNPLTFFLPSLVGIFGVDGTGGLLG